jgi:hypothetical protein
MNSELRKINERIAYLADCESHFDNIQSLCLYRGFIYWVSYYFEGRCVRERTKITKRKRELEGRK